MQQYFRLISKTLRIVAILALAPVALCALLSAFTFIGAALTGWGSDVLIWSTLGALSTMSVFLCTYRVFKSKYLQLRWVLLIFVASVLLTTPGIALMLTFVKNPP